MMSKFVPQQQTCSPTATSSEINPSQQIAYGDAAHSKLNNETETAIKPLWLYGYCYLSLDKTVWTLLLDFEYQLDPNAMEGHVMIPITNQEVIAHSKYKKGNSKANTPTNIELLQQSFLEYSNANFKECLTTLQELIERKTVTTPARDDELLILNSLVALYVTVILNYSTILSTQYQSYHNSMELLKVGEIMLKQFKNSHLQMFFSSLIEISKSNYFRKRKKPKLVHYCCKEAFNRYNQTGCLIYSQYILQALATSCLYCKKHDEAIQHFENNLFLYAHQKDNVYVQHHSLDYFNRILTFICENEYFLIINKCFNMFNYGVTLYEKSTERPSQATDSINEILKCRYFIFQAIDMMHQHISSHHNIVIEKRWLKHMVKTFKVISLKFEHVPIDCPMSIQTLMNKFCEQDEGLMEGESHNKNTSPFRNQNYYIMTLNKAIHFVIKENQKQQILETANIDEDEYMRVKKMISILPLLKCDPFYSNVLIHESHIRSQKQSISESLDHAVKTLKSSKLFLSPLRMNHTSYLSSECNESPSDVFPTMFAPISLDSSSTSFRHTLSPIKLSPLNFSRPSTTGASSKDCSSCSESEVTSQLTMRNDVEKRIFTTLTREKNEKQRLEAIIVLQAFLRMILARRELQFLQCPLSKGAHI
nr:unnamed protein product [Naegleria fowleri]